MKRNIHNYKKFLLNKIKYLFQKTQFMFEHLPKKIAFKLSWVLLLSEKQGVGSSILPLATEFSLCC